MLFPDVNVLVHAHVEDAASNHHRYADRLVRMATGPDNMAILERLCRVAGATGKLVADAQHAAVALEHGCTMVSTDSDFGRFPDLRWQHPLRPRDA